MKKIMFVCLGNICRSPMAEALFNHTVNESGLARRFISDSSGTSDFHVGESADPRTIEALHRRGIKTNHKAQQFVQRHDKEYDYIVAMDASNKAHILRELGVDKSDKLHLMRDFDPIESGDVPDPWQGNTHDFDRVFKILDRSIRAFIKEIKKEG